MAGRLPHVPPISQCCWAAWHVPPTRPTEQVTRSSGGRCKTPELTGSPYVTNAQLLRVGRQEAGGLPLLHHVQVTWGHGQAFSLPLGPG